MANETIKKSVIALSRQVTRPVPADWGRSELTQFLTMAEEQAYASFAAMPRWVAALELIDRNLTENAPTYFHEIDRDRQAATTLYLRAFGTFRAAARLALSGQAFESTILVRSVLESAVYAWACGHSKPHRESWEARGDGAHQRKVAKQQFKWVDLLKMLGGVDAELAGRIRTLYEECIEYGAHPNVDGVRLRSDVRPLGNDRYEISTIFIGGEEAVLLSILELTRAMELVYRQLVLTVGDRLRILGIDKRVEEERRHVLQLIAELEQRGAE
jgi:hypothetical protein